MRRTGGEKAWRRERRAAHRGPEPGRRRGVGLL